MRENSVAVENEKHQVEYHGRVACLLKMCQTIDSVAHNIDPLFDVLIKEDLKEWFDAYLITRIGKFCCMSGEILFADVFFGLVEPVEKSSHYP